MHCLFYPSTFTFNLRSVLMLNKSCLVRLSLHKLKNEFSLLYLFSMMPLKGIKVLEIAGLAPAPFCGMVLADFGASVVRVDKVGPSPDVDCLSNGKRSVAIDLKNPKGVEVLKRLCISSDVLIEPFRKGVMERLGLGPEVLIAGNPRLIYSRLSGFGHEGCYSQSAGHDINYVAMSGVLSMLGGEAYRPTPPINLLADFGGGGLMCALGIVLALLERASSGRGQVVDCSMVSGTAYLASWLLRSQSLPLWGKLRGHNILDGGTHFYTTYETKDGGWMAVGALEPQFYSNLLEGLDLSDVPQLSEDYTESKRVLAERFKTKTRQEWTEVFSKLDACVTPVLSPEEAASHPHNTASGTFVPNQGVVPAPTPLLHRSPARTCAHLPRPHAGQHTLQVLTEAGLSGQEVAELQALGAVKCADSKL